MMSRDPITASVEETGYEISRLLKLQGEIGISLLGADSLPEMLRRCVEVVVKQLDAAFARIWTLNEKENVLELRASAGLYTHLDGSHSRIPMGEYKIGRIAQERAPHLTNRVIGDPRVHDQEWAKRERMVSFAGYPLLVEDRLVGVLGMFSRQTLPDTTLIALGAVANSIALGIERKISEKALRETEEFSRRVLASTSDCIKVLDLDFHLKYMSPVAMQLMEVDDFGRCENADWRTFWQEADRPLVMAAIDQALAGRAGTFHAFCPTMKGTPKWWDVIVTPIKDAEGRVVKLLSSSRDVTDRKKSELQQRQSIERFRTVADAMPQMVWTARPDGFVDYYNQQWLDYTGLTLEETQGWGWKQTQHPQDVQSTIDKWEISIATGEVFENEMRFLRAIDKSWRWHFTRAVPVRDENGKPIQWIGTCTDIDDRKAAEEELRAAREELEIRVAERTAALRREIAERQKTENDLRKLSGTLLNLRDTEQRRIARELHDSVGQLLAATTMSLAVAAAHANDMNPEAAQALSQADQFLREAIKEVRIVSHLLHPPLLDETGLPSAIRGYLEGYSQRGDIQTEVLISEDFGRLPIELETAIFRVIQECLTNIHRHSGSKTAKVQLSRTGDELRVEVEDKGKGMPLRQSAGVGLRGMRERLAQFGGTLEVFSNAAGTTVVARLPLMSPSIRELTA
jgi:PAS domain S-box-containing protein